MKTSLRRMMMQTGGLILIPLTVMAQNPPIGPEGRGQFASGPEIQEPNMNPPAANIAPDEPQQGSNQEYTVKKGDTLWDIAKQQKPNDPWYYRQIWAWNPELENPHWIEPGTVLRLYPSGEAVAEGPVQTGDVKGLEDGPDKPEDEDITISALGTDGKYASQDPKDEKVVVMGQIGMNLEEKIRGTVLIRRNSFISPGLLRAAGTVSHAFSGRTMFVQHDEVYLKFKDLKNIRLDETFVIVGRTREVQHPVSEALVGYWTENKGEVRITRITNEYAVGVISRTFSDVMRGDMVIPMRELSSRIRPRPNEAATTGRIILLEHHGSIMANEEVVFVDRGSRDGVSIGNTFEVIRRGDELYETRKEEYDRDRLPIETIARLLVIDVSETVSTCLIIRSMEALEVGDVVEMKMQK
ncbi:MAG: hypothetical protein GMKNLPBB_01362 [Myxococcota bacterium]|nr:hypothetical protein [Myxococcota bacterium]